MALTNIVQQIGSDGFSGILSGVNQITGSAGSIIKKVKSLVIREMDMILWVEVPLLDTGKVILG